MSETRHQKYIQHCYELGQQQMEKGNVPFVSIIVLEDEIVAEGINTIASDNNLLGHSELNVVLKARNMLDAEQLKRAVLYSIAEPCAMCSGAIFNAGIRNVVYGLSTPPLLKYYPDGLTTPCREILDNAGDYVEVVGPMMEQPILALFEQHWGH